MTPGLHLQFDITTLVGAEYNPREIDTDARERLKHSLALIGCAKPIIARGNTIVAGHQRTTGLLALGQTHGPVYILPAEASVYDEIRFNQLHNGTDMDIGDEAAFISELPPGHGFMHIPPGFINGNVRAAGANIRAEILRLVATYGAWGACVANERGQIFHAAQYALACKIMHRPCLVYVIPDGIEAEARHLLGASYGVFSYDKLPRATFIQAFAQMFRLREGAARGNHSPLYAKHVIPWLEANPGARVLDFGCGQGDYVKALAAKGHNIIGLEFFRRKPATEQIDVGAVNGMVSDLMDALRAGRFDAVVCDYVLNSVDSQQAEDDVLTCVSAFCKAGGRVFMSGRRRERIEWQNGMTQAVNNTKTTRYIEFLDRSGMTALFRKGEWFYQKFHGKADIARICERFGFTVVAEAGSSNETTFLFVATSAGGLPLEQVEAAIDREFNMPLSRAGRRLGRHEDVKRAYRAT